MRTYKYLPTECYIKVNIIILLLIALAEEPKHNNYEIIVILS